MESLEKYYKAPSDTDKKEDEELCPDLSRILSEKGGSSVAQESSKGKKISKGKDKPVSGPNPSAFFLNLREGAIKKSNMHKQ